MASAYFVQTANWTHREKLNQEFIRLTDIWAYSKSGNGDITYWHTIPKPEKKPDRQRYVTFERQRWHRAGRIYRNWGKTRKTCDLCKKRIPVPIRVMFTLKGK